MRSKLAARPLRFAALIGVAALLVGALVACSSAAKRPTTPTRAAAARTDSAAASPSVRATPKTKPVIMSPAQLRAQASAAVAKLRPGNPPARCRWPR